MIVGLYSKARHGKNSLATYLQEAMLEKYNISFIEIAFAGLLKEMCAEHFGLTYEQLYGDQKEMPTTFNKKVTIRPFCGGLGQGELPTDLWTPREIMQEVGEFFRGIDRDFWVNNLNKYIIERQTQAQRVLHFIITDVRHINECEYVKNNGTLIKIVRDGAPEIHGMSHISETAMDGKDDSYFDIVIDNNGSLEDLQKTAKNLADALMKINKLKQEGGLV